jgi:hypothetical protein
MDVHTRKRSGFAITNGGKATVALARQVHAEGDAFRESSLHVAGNFFDKGSHRNLVGSKRLRLHFRSDFTHRDQRIKTVKMSKGVIGGYCGQDLAGLHNP